MARTSVFQTGKKAYFFAGSKYIRVTRGEEGPGTVDPNYPKRISEWGWGEFTKGGINAAFQTGKKAYFFAASKYIRVTRGEEGPGTVDPNYPKRISEWGWGEFGKAGINAAFQTGKKAYFFAGSQYIRVTRGEEGPGTVDPNYPKPISEWGWGEFGKAGINAAFQTGKKAYFFAGSQYIRVTRGQEGPGTVDPNYPKPISEWGWSVDFMKDWLSYSENG